MDMNKTWLKTKLEESNIDNEILLKELMVTYLISLLYLNINFRYTNDGQKYLTNLVTIISTALNDSPEKVQSFFENLELEVLKGGISLGQAIESF